MGLASLTGGGQPTPEGNSVTLVAGDDATARAAQDTKIDKAKLEADRAKHQPDKVATTRSDSPHSRDTLDIYTAAKMNLLAGLKDPDSATVRNSFVSKLDNGGMAVCGEVNSKNGFGGMTGFKRFIASASNPEATLIEGEIETGFGSATDARLFPAAYQQFCTHPMERF